MLPQSFIDQVKSATDMIKLARKHVDLKKVGDGIWNGRCPNPDHRDSEPSFTVWEHDQSWCCYGCHNGKKNTNRRDKNYGSDCFAFVQWISNGKTGWKQAILQLAEQAQLQVPTNENQALYDQRRILAESYTKSLHGKAFNYLLSRGLSRKDMEEWKLGFDGNRITFPLFDRYRTVVGFTKRWLEMPEGQHDKYRNSPNSKIFNKGYYLYGIHLINDDCEEIRITEGPMDVVLSKKYGVHNIVATLGTSFTDGHIELVRNYGKVPVFCMDGDLAGLKSMRKSIEALAEAGIYSKILILPDGMDMADLALQLKDGLEDYIQANAMTYGFFRLRDMITQYDSKMHELKLKLYPDIVKLLEEVPGEEKFLLKDFIKQRLQLEL